jgi:hypothetical protein
MSLTHPKLDLISAPLSSFYFSAPFFLAGVDGQQRTVVELGVGSYHPISTSVSMDQIKGQQLLETLSAKLGSLAAT